ncbi:MAG TPA: LppX_LprAFG lipoprotein [Nitrolancea sp.]|nr:LppX_LprAFG lipoprotein [Nitrolancea sp.]
MRLLPVARMILLFVGIMALIACGSSKSGNNSSSATAVTAQSLLSNASTRFGQVNSLHFVLQIQGNVALDQANTLKLHGAEGDLARPDSAQAKADVTFLGATISLKFVSIGKDQYITNPITGAWETAPANLGYDPAVLFDGNQGITHVLGVLQNPTIVGSETINGEDAYHVTATVTKADAQPIAAGALTSATPAIDLWISKKSFDIVKLTLNDAGAAGASTTTWTLLISKQNEPVTIQRPNV